MIDNSAMGQQTRASSPPANDKPLGQILLEKSIISELQLELALKKQEQENGKYLGQILTEMGVAQSKVNWILDSYSKRKPIGEIMIDLGVIPRVVLEVLLQEQKNLLNEGIRKSFGALILEMGYTNYANLMKGFSKHFNMPIVSLQNFIPSESLQKAIGVAFARKNRIVVLENSETRVRLALAEPTPMIVEDLKKAFLPRKNVEFYLTSPQEIESCFQKKDPLFNN